MSKRVIYTEFCQHYKLDSALSESKAEYKKYSDNLNLMNGAFSEEITNKAISKAKDLLT